MKITLEKKVIFVIVVALFARVLFALYMGNRSPVLDGTGYDKLAYNIWQHGEYSTELGVPSIRRSPVYPFFLAGIYAIFGHNYFIVRLMQSLIGALTCLLVYFIGKRTVNKEVGLIAAAISAVYPFFIYYTGYLLVETLYTFLIAAVIYQLIICVKNYSIKNQIISGVLMGLMILCKPTAFGFLPFCVISLLILWDMKKAQTYLRILVVMSSLFIVTIPWGLRNHKHFGKFYLAHMYGGANFIASIYIFETDLNEPEYKAGHLELNSLKVDGEKLEGLKLDNYYFRKALKIYMNKPIYFLRGSVKKFMRFWRPIPHINKIDFEQAARSKVIIILGFLFFDIVLIFGLIGAVISLKNWRNMIFLYCIIISFTIVYTIIWPEARYRRPVMPYMIIFSAVGLNYIYQKICEKKFKKEKGK